MKSRWILAILLSIAGSVSLAAPIRVAVPEPSKELGTMPSSEYVTDYWAPPVDMVPATPIAKYNLNVRVPSYRWLKYEGAYALALDIRPIEKSKIEKEIAVGIIQTNRNPQALVFDLSREKSAAVRRVGIYNLKLDATEFCAASFKVRTKAKNAGEGLTLTVAGTGFYRSINTLKPTKDVVKAAAKDGFTSYTVNFPQAKVGSFINSLVFEVEAATAADFVQQYEIIDFHLKRPAPKARFTDVPARRWTKKENVYSTDAPLKTADCISDIFAYARAEGAGDTIAALPGKYELRAQLEKEKDGGFTVEYVKEIVAGVEMPAVKITLEKGPRCLLRFPVAFDGLEYNTMTFAAKVEVFDGAKPCLGDKKPMLWGTNQIELNKPFDTFQISFFSKTHDYCDWTRWGLAQADYCQNKDLSAAISRGNGAWRAFAYDIANSDPSNNKSSFYTKLSHWCFYYNNKKIPEGKKVVITIADPRLTKGVMLAGGDLEKYKEFLKSHDPKRMIDFDALETALEAPKKGRLEKPIPFLRNRAAVGKIYNLGATYPAGTSKEAAASYSTILDDAIKMFKDVLQRKYALTVDIPVETRLPGPKAPKAVNSIIIGGKAYQAIDKKTYDDDMKKLAGTPGVAIRSDGTNIYVYAANYNYAGNVRALAFGLYELLENNTDLINSHLDSERRWGPQWIERNFALDKSGEMDLVWGDDFVHIPPFPESNMRGVGGPNRIPGFYWQGDWRSACQRMRSVNHWWGYGTEPIGDEKKGEPNERWGRDANGKPMVPGCYTGHPCLIRVLNQAREAYVNASGFARISDNRPLGKTQPPGKAFTWNSCDIHGLWVEDSISMCQCEECLSPIRLADGSTVGPESPAFRSTQFYANGSAMINAVNVYAKRTARIESIGYLWMAPVPLINVSRSYNIRYCPYIRKNYFVPIYAPMNDMHYRAMYHWAQQDVWLSMYEYYLGVGARPWADIAAYDLKVERDFGFYEWHAEAENGLFCRMDKWVMERLLWGASGDDVPALRAYYLKRYYRDAAEYIAKFYSLIMTCASQTLSFASPMEFEDDAIILRTAMRVKAPGLFSGTVAEELEKYVKKAEESVRDHVAKRAVAKFRSAWDAYLKKAKADEEKWLKDVDGGAEMKEMKIVGAPK